VQRPVLGRALPERAGGGGAGRGAGRGGDRSEVRHPGPELEGAAGSLPSPRAGPGGGQGRRDLCLVTLGSYVIPFSIRGG
jgi:hypothetical protein